MTEPGDREDADHHLEMISDCMSGLQSAHETLKADKILINDGKLYIYCLYENSSRNNESLLYR